MRDGAPVGPCRHPRHIGRDATAIGKDVAHPRLLALPGRLSGEHRVPIARICRELLAQRIELCRDRTGGLGILHLLDDGDELRLLPLKITPLPIDRGEIKGGRVLASQGIEVPSHALLIAEHRRQPIPDGVVNVGDRNRDCRGAARSFAPLAAVGRHPARGDNHQLRPALATVGHPAAKDAHLRVSVVAKVRGPRPVPLQPVLDASELVGGDDRRCRTDREADTFLDRPATSLHDPIAGRPVEHFACLCAERLTLTDIDAIGEDRSQAACLPRGGARAFVIRRQDAIGL